MAVITPTGINAVLDQAVDFAIRYVGSQASGLGVGINGQAWGAVQASTALDTAILALGDLDPIVALAQPAQTLNQSIDGAGQAANQLSSFLSALQSHVTKYQIPNVRALDDYLTYCNITTGPWQCLQNPFWYTLFGKWLGGSYPSIWNCFYEVLQGGSFQGTTFTNALAKFVVGTGFTGGFSIDTTKYAGGFPQVHFTAITGSGLVTVTGTSYDPVSKSFQTGMTWTATCSATGVTALAASTAPANSLIAAVSAVVCAGGISAGTLYVEAARPAGRPLLV